MLCGYRPLDSSKHRCFRSLNPDTHDMTFRPEHIWHRKPNKHEYILKDKGLINEMMKAFDVHKYKTRSLTYRYIHILWGSFHLDIKEREMGEKTMRTQLSEHRLLWWFCTVCRLVPAKLPKVTCGDFQLQKCTHKLNNLAFVILWETSWGVKRFRAPGKFNKGQLYKNNMKD